MVVYVRGVQSNNYLYYTSIKIITRLCAVTLSQCVHVDECTHICDDFQVSLKTVLHVNPKIKVKTNIKCLSKGLHHHVLPVKKSQIY